MFCFLYVNTYIMVVDGSVPWKSGVDHWWFVSAVNHGIKKSLPALDNVLLLA